MKKILILTSLIAIFSSANAQIKFEHATNIEVKHGSKTLNMPFAGGLDAPQFSEFDLNNDGINDLVVFDREGNRISTYLNNGIANQISYTYAPQYVKFFPKLNDWLLMRDYNGDGKNDIFTSAPGGVKVFLNTSTNNTISFQLKESLLLFQYGSIRTNVYVEQQDIPAILDVDDDGDIDILTFSKSIDSSGESIYWYKNLSIEKFGSKDTFDFVIGKECWGKFRESYDDCRVNLQYPHGICGLGGRILDSYTEQEFKDFFSPKSQDPMHSGSTLLIFDANNDGKKDILIGDLSCSNMYMLYNGTNNISPEMTSVTRYYPTSRPIDVFVFPAAFLIDVNNDGKKDLIIAPNTPNNSDNFENIQLYLRNDSTMGANIFDYHSNNFFESEMVDVAEGSAPTFVDYNGDGLEDIVISNTGYYTASGVYTSGLALYENTASSPTSTPKYNLVSRDWMNLSSLNIRNMAPSFGDIDGDGDLDMVTGSLDGTLHYFRNNATIGQPINLTYIPNFFNGADVGNNSVPYVYDLDNDGKLEVIVGERFFNINLFSNTGTLANPNYTLTTDSLWKIDMSDIINYPSGRTSMAIAKMNRFTNDKYLLISNGNGVVYIFKNLPADYNSPIQNFTSQYDSLYLVNGYFGSANIAFPISVKDLNGDELPELISGTPQGGVLFYWNTSNFMSVDNESAQRNISIYPNPTSNSINIYADFEFNTVRILSINGQLIKSFDNINNQNIKIDDLSNGMYFIECQGKGFRATQKLIINK